MVVYIIRTQPPNDHANKISINGNSVEVALWIVGRPFGTRLTGIAGAA